MDSPTRGVDIGVKTTMYQLIARMKKEGYSILIISEEMPELIGMCDEILVMKDGKCNAELQTFREPFRTADYRIYDLRCEKTECMEIYKTTSKQYCLLWQSDAGIRPVRNSDKGARSIPLTT